MGAFAKRFVMPIVLLALSAALVVRALHDRSSLKQLATEPSDVAALEFSASDANGRQIDLDSKPYKRRVIVAFDSDKALSELAYWNKVCASLPQSIELIGICQTKACTGLLPLHTVNAFPMAAFGSYEATLAVLKRNAEGYIPVMNKQGGILASVKMRAKAEEMAADLIKGADLEHP